MRIWGRTPAETLWIGWPAIYYLAVWINSSPTLAQGLAVGVPFALVFFAGGFTLCQPIFNDPAQGRGGVLVKYALSAVVLAVIYLFVAPLIAFLLVWATP